MIDIIIADDDEIICEGMKNTINWASIGVRVAGTANDGEEALQLIRDLKPQIAILDINMPFIDGLTLASKVSEEFPDLLVIILTAYKEFQYAQRAIKYKVFDYLTKPCHNNDVKETVLRAAEQIRLRKTEPDQKTARILTELIFGEEIDPVILREQCGILNSDDQFQVAALETLHVNTGTDTKELENAFRLLQGLLAGQKNIHVLLRRTRILLIIEYTEETTESSVIDLLRQCLNVLRGSTETAFSLGVGDIYPGVENVRRSYGDAKVNLEYRSSFPEGHIITSGDLNPDSVQYVDSFLTCEEEIRSSAAEGNPDRIIAAIENLYTQLISHGKISQSVCISLSTEMLIKLYRDIDENTLEAFLKNNRNILYRLNHENTIEGIRKCVLEGARGLCRYASEINRNDQLAVVSRALAYIDEHFRESDLSIREVADSVHVSVSYLQVLLKKYKDNSFSNYLNQVRMEEAMRLLKADNMKIFEVAFASGFNSSQYFSRKFKNCYGIEPREVKKH